MIDQFEIGQSYEVKQADHFYPLLDREGKELDGEETITGKTYRFKVLKKLDGDHAGFIKVHNYELNKTHLFFAAEAEAINPIN